MFSDDSGATHTIIFKRILVLTDSLTVMGYTRPCLQATEVEASLGAHSPPLDWRGGKYAALVAEVRRAEARLGAAWVRLGDVSAGEEARSLGSSVAEELALEARTEAVFEELRAMDGMVAEMEAELAEGLREMLPPGWFEEQPERVSALLGVMDDLGGSQV
jgi:hypothetical protein